MENETRNGKKGGRSSSSLEEDIAQRRVVPQIVSIVSMPFRFLPSRCGLLLLGPLIRLPKKKTLFTAKRKRCVHRRQGYAFQNRRWEVASFLSFPGVVFRSAWV